MKKIIIAVSAVVAVAGLVWYARPGESEIKKETLAAVGQGALSAQETDYDFGSISMAAGKVSRIFEIKNSAAEIVNIAKIYTSCMCTQATLAVGEKNFGPYGMPGHGFFGNMVGQDLNSGEQAQVEVVFDPAAHGPAGVGPVARTVFVETKSREILKLNFKALVTP